MAGSTLTIKPLGPLASAITSLFQAPPNDIRGIETTNWFGPLQPVRPIAPEGTEPRGFQYAPGQNLIYTPRAAEELSSVELRQAAKYPLARVLIENVKDLVSEMPLNARLKRLPGETGKAYSQRKPDLAKLTAITDMIEHPNPDQNRQQFMRQLLEDLLVIDSPCVLNRTTKSGKLIELRPIDGSTITRYIDPQGYTPQPPSPAYAQVWYGSPMVDLTTRQLRYAARNILPGHIYGCSPVDQAIQWISIGIERLQFKQAAYTDGTIPDGYHVIPPGVDPSKITEGQAWQIANLAGQLQKRRQLQMIQGYAPDGKDQFLFPKQALLADNYDELEINCFCFAFGVSRQRLSKMMNRSAAESDQAASEKEGLEPWLSWAMQLWNYIIQTWLGFTDYEAVYEDPIETDPVKQAEIDKIDISIGKRTINECREDEGDEPRSEPEADMLLVITASGAIPLNADQEVDRTKKKLAAMPQPEPAAGPIPKTPKPDATAKALVDAIEKLNRLARKTVRAHETAY